MTPAASGSPAAMAFTDFFAITVVTCGAIGGISGSTLTSSRHGRDAFSARSHASPISAGLSQ